jgi:hypothetical protein
MASQLPAVFEVIKFKHQLSMRSALLKRMIKSSMHSALLKPVATTVYTITEMV